MPPITSICTHDITGVGRPKRLSDATNHVNQYTRHCGTLARDQQGVHRAGVYFYNHILKIKYIHNVRSSHDTGNIVNDK